MKSYKRSCVRVKIVPFLYQYQDTIMSNQELLHVRCESSPRKRGFEDSCRTDSFDSVRSSICEVQSPRRESTTKMIEYLSRDKSSQSIPLSKSFPQLSIEFQCDKDSNKNIGTNSKCSPGFKRVKTFSNLVLLETHALIDSLDVDGLFI